MILSYETIDEDLAKHWGDAWDDPYAREWERLVRLTWRYLRRHNGGSSLAMGLTTPERRLSSAIRDGLIKGVPPRVIVPRCPRLAELHADMERRFDNLLARYPRFALRLRLQDISEEVDAQSWPYGYEFELYRWAGGPPEPAPPLVSLSHHATLARLRAVTGGWWIWVDGPPKQRWSGRIVWKGSAEMDAIVASMEHGGDA